MSVNNSVEARSLFNRVRALHLAVGQYALFGSAPLMIRGWKEGAHDIDVLVSDEVWNRLQAEKMWQTKRADSGSLFLVNDEIEVWHDWKPGKWNVQQLIDDAEIIDDLPFVQLEAVIRSKQLRGKEKDLEDLKTIREHLLMK